MPDMTPQEGLIETDEEEECRNCDKPTQTTDYIGPICQDCYEAENA